MVVRSQVELSDYLRRTAVDTIIQEYAPGSEFGVFYYRLPWEDRGRIFSITEKRFPVVVGDGESALVRLNALYYFWSPTFFAAAYPLRVVEACSGQPSARLPPGVLPRCW